MRRELGSVVALFLCLVTISGSSPAIAQESRSISIRPVWTFDLTDDRAVKLFDKEINTQHGNLIGASPVGLDGIVVYDEIQEKLVRFDKKGTVVWTTGQVGSGPEDHRPPCEPVVLENGQIALAAYGIEPKIVYYNGDGSYQSSIDLPGYVQFHRYVKSHDSAYGLTHRAHGQISTGLEIEVYLAKVEEHGLSLKEVLVNTGGFKTWQKGMTVDESDFWIMPRVEAGPLGTVIIQKNVFQPTVEIYSPELRREFTIKGDWLPEARPESEIQAVIKNTDGAKNPTRTHRALPHVFTVRDEEIWMQKTVTDSSLTFATFGTSGSPLGDVRLPSPFCRGDKLTVVGDLLLCLTETESPGGISQRFSLYVIDKVGP